MFATLESNEKIFNKCPLCGGELEYNCSIACTYFSIFDDLWSGHKCYKEKTDFRKNSFKFWVFLNWTIRIFGVNGVYCCKNRIKTIRGTKR